MLAWRLRRPAAYLALAVAVALSVALYTATRANAAAATPAPHFSATQLADGILFGDGPVAPYLAGPGRHTATMTANARQVERLVNQALTRDPRLAASFAARIQSGDRLKIESALHDLGVAYKAVLDRQFGAAKVNKAINHLRDTVGQARPVDVANVNYELNVNYEVSYAVVDLAIEIAALLVVIVLEILAPAGVGAASGNGARLSAEMLTDRIATRLAAA
jgi:SdpC family antimicrobial peptide